MIQKIIIVCLLYLCISALKQEYHKITWTKKALVKQSQMRQDSQLLSKIFDDVNKSDLKIIEKNHDSKLIILTLANGFKSNYTKKYRIKLNFDPLNIPNKDAPRNIKLISQHTVNIFSDCIEEGTDYFFRYSLDSEVQYKLEYLPDKYLAFQSPQIRIQIQIGTITLDSYYSQLRKAILFHVTPIVMITVVFCLFFKEMEFRQTKQFFTPLHLLLTYIFNYSLHFISFLSSDAVGLKISNDVFIILFQMTSSFVLACMVLYSLSQSQISIQKKAVSIILVLIINLTPDFMIIFTSITIILQTQLFKKKVTQITQKCKRYRLTTCISIMLLFHYINFFAITSPDIFPYSFQQVSVSKINFPVSSILLIDLNCIIELLYLSGVLQKIKQTIRLKKRQIKQEQRKKIEKMKQKSVNSIESNQHLQRTK